MGNNQWFIKKLRFAGSALNQRAVACIVKLTISTKNMPKHVAIIMDGNGRWAQQRFLPRTAGHAKGASRVRNLIEHSAKLGISYLTLFAFSTENWSRPEEEVSTLMGLFVQYLEKEMDALADAGVRLRLIGDISAFSVDLQHRIQQAELVTKHNKGITLVIAANYGGRWDLLQAMQRWHIDNTGASSGALTEQALAAYLSTAGVPDVDLLIRTGGEQRISNFLLWQSAYAELYFSDVLWPDFDSQQLDESLSWYSQRMRRFGRTTEQVS